MPKSENLGLELTNDGSALFSEWWKMQNGDNLEEEGLSNMQIIDKAIGNINALLDEINGEVI